MSDARPASALLERFVSFGNASTRRKTAMWSALLLALHALSWLGAHALGGEHAPADLVTYDLIVGLWTGGLALALAATIPTPRAGRDGRWTAYAFVVLYTSPLVFMAYVLDSVDAGAAPLAFVPVAVLAFGVVFDERIGAACLLYAIGALFTVSLLEGSVLPAGRVFLQAAGPGGIAFVTWWLTMLLFQASVLVAAMSLLAVGAERLQRARLLQALTAARQGG